MSEYKQFKVSYTMIDGEVFTEGYDSVTREAVVTPVCYNLEKTCFSLGPIPNVILVSANVRNVDIVEKL